MGATGLAPSTTRTTSGPPQGRTLAEANRLLARTWQELAEARAIISRQTRRAWWEREVDRVPHRDLSATDKLVLRDLYGQQEQWATFDRSGPQRVWCEGRARELGLSADTYARALKTLHECQTLTRTVEKDPTSGNTRVTIELAEKFWAPATISRPTPRQQGGERQVLCWPRSRFGPGYPALLSNAYDHEDARPSRALRTSGGTFRPAQMLLGKSVGGMASPLPRGVRLLAAPA